MNELVVVCCVEDGSPESYLVVRQRASELKWIRRRESAQSTFFDDLISDAGASSVESTVFLDAIFDSVVRKRGSAKAPEVLITFQGRKFKTVQEWKLRLKDVFKPGSDVKEWANRHGATGVYLKGTLS